MTVDPNWKPVFPEVEHQCASCPFRDGNEKEWAGVVDALKRKSEQSIEAIDRLGQRLVTPDPETCRANVRASIDSKGANFVCHGTAISFSGGEATFRPGFRDAMKTDSLDDVDREGSQLKQCIGATRWARGSR